MKNDLIFMTTTVTTDVAANAVIPLTTITRKRGCALQSANNAITLAKVGYYKVSGTVTFTAATTGDYSIGLFRNGTQTLGIESGVTVSTADQTKTLPIEGIVRAFCGEFAPTVTLVNTGTAMTITNVAIDMEYLG